MPRKLTAIFLSALVLPGLGQIYVGNKIKGGIIIVLVNVFILAALALLAPGVLELAMLAQSGQVLSAPFIIQTLQEHSAGARWLILLFVALWVYSIGDLMVTTLPSEEQRGG